MIITHHVLKRHIPALPNEATVPGVREPAKR